jgi:Flp pilus assembly protein TadB
VYATVGLILSLVLYALVGGAFAFNVRGLSDQAAAHFRGKPWLYRQIGRDNPNMWRGGGVIMLACGVAVAVWIVAFAVWQPPRISTVVALLVLLATAGACVAAIARARRKRSGELQPPERSEGRYSG